MIYELLKERFASFGSDFLKECSTFAEVIRASCFGKNGQHKRAVTFANDRHIMQAVAEIASFVIGGGATGRAGQNEVAHSGTLHIAEQKGGVVVREQLFAGEFL